MRIFDKEILLLEGTAIFGSLGFSRIHKPNQFALSVNSRKMPLSFNRLLYELLTEDK